MQASEFDVAKIKTSNDGFTTVSSEELKNSGVTIATYGIKDGDHITFLESYDENTIQGRPVGTGIEVLVAVLRNGKEDWYSLSDVRRADHEMKAVDKFREMMRALPNDLMRLEKLQEIGTIVAGKPVEYQVVKSFSKGEDGRMHPDTDEDGNILLRKRTTYEIKEAKK